MLRGQVGLPYFANCIGFLDATVRPICKPGPHGGMDRNDPRVDIVQRVVYNGYKRVHAIKFQSFATPDGIIMDLSGPYAGLLEFNSVE